MKLIFCLNAFGDNRNRQKLCQVDDELQHMRIAARLEGIADKLHVEFHGVDRQSGQHIQRGITRSEIIHLNAETQPPQAHNRFYIEPFISSMTSPISPSMPIA